MRKIVLALFLSSVFVALAEAKSCDPTTKSCIYAEAWQKYYYNSKCGKSGSLSDRLCRLKNSVNVRTK